MRVIKIITIMTTAMTTTITTTTIIMIMEVKKLFGFLNDCVFIVNGICNYHYSTSNLSNVPYLAQ